MKVKYLLYSISALFLLLLSVPLFSVVAQTLSSSERAQLEAQLAQVQAEEVTAQSDLVAAQSKSSSLQNNIAVLTAKIKTEQLAIQANQLTIQTLGDGISTQQGEINNLDAQITQNQQDIGDIFRQIQQSDNTSILEIVLSNNTISQFLDDAATLESLQQDLDVLSAQLSANESSSTAEKNTLVTQQDAAIDAQYAVQQEQATLQANQTQENELLSISQTNAAAYTSLIADEKAEADQINAKLFALAGGSNPIPFGTAYQYALDAQKATGVDPAFLLAILTQESNLGSNQGTCYLTDATTGAGVSVKSGRTFDNVMDPDRDVQPFLTITGDLGVNPYQTVVSCPQSIGWGGAMGPAQFIASTWMLFAARIATALDFTGMANPWNPQHAFMASSLYLSDLGAGAGGYTAEDNAACRYYSGSPCSKSALVASYGSSVMELASQIQATEIDKLQSI